MKKDIPRVIICNVGVDDISRENAISAVLRLAKDADGHHLVVTVNSEFVMMARRNRKFAAILEKADLSLADGMFVVISKLILEGKAQERITGVDLVNLICANNGEKPLRIGFLGGFNGVADRVVKRQQKIYPKLKVVLASPGDPAIEADMRLRKKISGVGRIDVLFVAYGMGQQEFWIERNRKYLDVGVFIGVGGAFDYISGKKTRAPVFMQNIGLEWLWRLANEPSRIWRMRVLPVFVVLVIFQWFLKKLSFLQK